MQTVDHVAARRVNDGHRRRQVDRHIIRCAWKNIAAPVERIAPRSSVTLTVPGDRVETQPSFKSFDPRLRAHKIHKLSALYQRTIYAVEIEADLRATFFIEANTVWTVDIGTHDIYKG